MEDTLILFKSKLKDMYIRLNIVTKRITGSLDAYNHHRW